jgi:hypothetical protein
MEKNKNKNKKQLPSRSLIPRNLTEHRENVQGENCAQEEERPRDGVGAV